VQLNQSALAAMNSYVSTERHSACHLSDSSDFVITRSIGTPHYNILIIAQYCITTTTYLLTYLLTFLFTLYCIPISSYRDVALQESLKGPYCLTHLEHFRTTLALRRN